MPETSVVVVYETSSPGDPDPDSEIAQDLDVSDVIATYGGTVGIALVDANSVTTAGELTTEAAWSTIKVPIALAAAREGVATEDVVWAAIADSDNAAAEQLWNSLGPEPSTLVAAEIGQLAPAPTVLGEVTKPPFSPFGQTQWTLIDQAKFGFRLQCHPLVDTVLGPMSQISPDHAYGLGLLPGASFKGGWGADDSGSYLVRQFGFLETDEGIIGISLAAKPEDGTYESGIEMLNLLAERAFSYIEVAGKGGLPCA